MHGTVTVNRTIDFANTVIGYLEILSMGNQVGKLYSELLKILYNHHFIPMDIIKNFSKFKTNYQKLPSVHKLHGDVILLFSL
jgi:hypothetical protein